MMDKIDSQSFTILGADGRWTFADAQIDGETVRVTIPPGTAPSEVRYAWADNPTTANLVNADGLPALPFAAKVTSK